MKVSWESWKEPLRDAVIVYALTFAGGFTLGTFGILPTSENTTIYLAANIVMLIVGFALIGSTTGHPKVHYLPIVAFLVWFLNLTNVPLGSATVSQWMMSSFGIILFMVLGGVLSSGFIRLRTRALPSLEALHSLQTHSELDQEMVPAVEVTPPEETRSVIQIHESKALGHEQGQQAARSSYIRCHWRGELSLIQSFWINTVLVTMFFQLPFQLLKHTDLSVDDFITRFPTLYSITAISFWPLFYVVCTWQLIGLWRSAENYAEVAKSSIWPRFVQIIVVLGVFQAAFLLARTALPQINEYAKIMLGSDDYSHFTVRVIRQGTEIEILGGIGFGLTSEVKRQLAAYPDIHVIHLNSIGGRIVEARQLRSLIASNHLITYSSRGCLSACVFAYLGGKSRVLHRDAKLGFHQPSFPGLPVDQLAEQIDREKELFRSVGIDPKFIERAFTTPNKEMWRPSPEELLRAGVITDISDGAQFAMTETGLAANIENLEAELLKIPAYQLIKRHDPETFERVVSVIGKALRGDASKADIASVAREQIGKLYARYMPISHEDALLNATRNIVNAISTLEKTNPEACYAFLFPGSSYVDTMSLLPKDIQHPILDSMVQVIETGVSNPQAIPKESQVSKTLEQLTDALSRRYGNDVALLADAAAPGVNKAKICSMTAALYQEVLKLPKKESVKLLRFLFAAG